ncbi:MAG: hypothetical protein AB8Y53_00315 [Coxiella-like endosymbiont]
MFIKLVYNNGGYHLKCGNNLGHGVLVAHMVEQNITFALAINVSCKLINFYKQTLVADLFKECKELLN